ncbi:hypothetical protein JKP88DRAFT_351689 [Tribonema minus]|uniref:Uncharacterized protein n=1 Tax=Tribonema minus TaxID=303371 RepID=A0A835YJL9_9STRA|nr:hypothetical protein JKP88DRAFT_351689 [Tribonema minus]
MDGTSSPADYRAYVEDACAKRNKRIIRWYIAKVEAGTAHAEVVVADASPATASPPISTSNDFDLDDYGFGGKGSWFDIGELVRAKVKESNDVLIEGNRRLNEEAHFLGQRLQEEAYIWSRRVRGQGEQDIFPPRVQPPPIDAEFASKAYQIPETVFVRQTGRSAAAVRAAVEASQAKYFPYFERGAGGPGSLPTDLRNHTYYSFATYAQWRVFLADIKTPNAAAAYAQWRVFLADIKTPKAAAAFSAAVGAEALSTLFADVPLKRYDARKDGLGEALAGVRRLLDRFQSAGYIVGYKLQTDSIDAASFTDGAPCAFTLVVDLEAPLAAKIRLDYEGYKAPLIARIRLGYEGCKMMLPDLVADAVAEYLRAAAAAMLPDLVANAAAEYLRGCGAAMLPDLVANAVAEYLRGCGAVARFTSYYLDDAYRPRAEDYRPVQTLIEWTLEEQ